MLSSKKGNLLCFQWELERFQKSHRDKMNTVTPVMDTKPSAERPRKGPTILRKSAREKLVESDVRRRNAFLVEKMAHIYHTGGFQRRSLNEFQDVKAALAFGKANVAVFRAARNGRFTARRKEQERIRHENAHMLSRLASTKPTSIDFQKFETDFMNSRAHHRLARVNRTVGHTSVVLGQTNLAPHHSGAIGIAQSPVSLPTRQPHGCDAKDRAPSPRHRRSGQLDQRRGAHPLQPRQRPASAGQVPLNRPRRGIEGNNQSSKKGPGRKSCGASNDEKASDITALPHRPPAGVEGKRHAVTRPHTASGLRRDGGHHDVLESRAADPGWARGIGVCMAERPSSASARIKWGHWHDDDESYLMKKMRTSRVFRCESKPDMELHRGGREEPDKNPPQLTSIESNDEVEVQEGQKLCLGRTCLGEVKILVKPTSTSGGDANGQGAPRQMTFKCSSLDGLIRQDRRVQRTLRGFVVEVELVPPSRASLNSNFHSNKKGRASVTATVSAVQDLLDNATPSESHGISTATFTDDSVSTLDVSDNLQPFRDALPLDNRGNYPELRALLGREGQRQLLESLLGSCRVELENSNVVGVTLVKLNVGEDPQISVVTKHPSPPP